MKVGVFAARNHYGNKIHSEIIFNWEDSSQVFPFYTSRTMFVFPPAIQKIEMSGFSYILFSSRGSEKFSHGSWVDESGAISQKTMALIFA